MDMNEIFQNLTSELESLKDVLDLQPIVDGESEEFLRYHSFLKKTRVNIFRLKSLREELNRTKALQQQLQDLRIQCSECTELAHKIVEVAPKFLTDSRHAAMDEDKENRSEQAAATRSSRQTKSGATKPKSKSEKHQIGAPNTASFIDASDFAAVPVYMKGRISLSEINRAIKSLNTTFVEKYKIYNRPLRKGKYDALREQQHAYFEQDTAELAGQHFITEEDLHELGDMKIDRRFNTVMAILRHCSKIRQTKTGKITRFVIL